MPQLIEGLTIHACGLVTAGSVTEQSRQCKKMREQGPLVVYSHDGQKGGLSPEVPTFWGDYYRTHPRDVREVRLMV